MSVATMTPPETKTPVENGEAKPLNGQVLNGASSSKSGVEFLEGGAKAIYTVGNGNVIHYIRREGIYFNAKTAPAVVSALLNARHGRYRVRIHLGETDDSKFDVGRDWMEEFNVEGTIGSSMGPLKIPLLLSTARSSGGFHILDHCIVKITTTANPKRILYQHPNYRCAELTIKEIGPNVMYQWKGKAKSLRSMGYTHTVCHDGEPAANFKSLKAAQRYVAKMS
jgi:hypothetical protein